MTSSFWEVAKIDFRFGAKEMAKIGGIWEKSRISCSVLML